MKTEIITENPEVKEIDWSKKTLVRSTHVVVLATGEHDEYRFSGYVIHSRIDKYSNLSYSQHWEKKAFSPITEPITIKFIP